MGSHYYYLVSQLPYLVFGQIPPMSSEAFKELARNLLTKEDAKLLDLLSLDPQPPIPDAEGPSYAEKVKTSKSAFIDGWREWERVLRLNLAKQRALKLKWDTADMVEAPASPADAVTTAVKAVAVTDSPIEGENVLDRGRWNAIEELHAGDFFDRNTIFVYLLKLYILERNASFQTEIGFTEYKSLYASILNNENELEGTTPAGDNT